jgi:hypothetical protein
MAGIRRLIAALTVGLTVSGCALLDSGVEWEEGPFVVIWIDLFANAHLAHRVDEDASSSITEPCVTAVGSNSAVVVAERIVPGTKTSEFYVVYKDRFEQSRPEAAWLVGPLSPSHYARLRTQQRMPELKEVVPRHVCESAA